MRRLSSTLAAALLGALVLTGCSNSSSPAAITSPPVMARAPSLTLQVRLASTHATVGESIDATTVLTNHTGRTLHLSGTCPGQWAYVGLTKRGVSFDPAILTSSAWCVARTAVRAGASLSTPITISTLWDGCGGSGVPACPPFDGAPLLPLGRYAIKVVDAGLPKGTVVLPTPHVLLVSASTGRPSGPEGGSLDVQPYGCGTAHPQPPITVTVTHDGHVVAGPSRLPATSQLVLPLRPGSYAVRTDVRSPMRSTVHDGFVSFVTVVPRCQGS